MEAVHTAEAWGMGTEQVRLMRNSWSLMSWALVEALGGCSKPLAGASRVPSESIARAESSSQDRHLNHHRGEAP
jgi:hypothetical protein